jgi:hypothetical protein
MRSWNFKDLLDNLVEKRKYCKLKDEALDHSLWNSMWEKAMNLSQHQQQNE